MTQWLIRNQILISVIVAWALAQLIKTFLYLRLDRLRRDAELAFLNGMCPCGDGILSVRHTFI